MPVTVKKIISGGQTGADRAALDFAIENKIAHGGWVPRGRIAEDGPIPDKYRLQEAPAPEYDRRTELNVIDSEGTLIISHGELKGGSALTLRLAAKHRRPVLHIDLKTMPQCIAALKIVRWLSRFRVETLNVAGARASRDPDIYRATRCILEIVFQQGLSVDLHQQSLSKAKKGRP